MSVHGGRGAWSWSGGCLVGGGWVVTGPGGGVRGCLVKGGCLLQGGCLVETPRPLLLRAVPILLECILVFMTFFKQFWKVTSCNQGIINKKRSQFSIMNNIVNDKKGHNIRHQDESTFNTETVMLPEFFRNITWRLTRVPSRGVFLLPANEVWGKVMFLHLCVILFTGGGSLPNPPRCRPPWMQTPPRLGRPPRVGQTPLDADSPRLGRPPRMQTPQCWADPPQVWVDPLPGCRPSLIQSTSGRYASYWKAYLFNIS